MSDRIVTTPPVNPPENHQVVYPPTSTSQTTTQLTTTSTTGTVVSEPTLSNKEANKSLFDVAAANSTISTGSVLEHSAPESRDRSVTASKASASASSEIISYATLSITELTKVAIGGNADAQFELGKRFDLGIDIPKNYEQALKWYLQSAEQGHFKAQHNLAGMYLMGNGIEEDRTKAADWYRKAAAQGSSRSQFNLATMYDNGEGVPQDDAEAFYWYLKAADLGHAQAKYEVGLKYVHGSGVKQDVSVGYRWISEAAEQDEPEAQYVMARTYSHGIEGIEKDRVKSFDLYFKAANQGHVKAQYKLGIDYQYGFTGNKIDLSKAIEFFLKAANQGYAKAQCQLGWIYNENGIYKDYAKAVYWLRLAAEQGNLGGQSTLADMYEKGHGVKQSDEDALIWFTKAAVQGDKHSQRQLSLAYKDGKGVKKDLNRSVYWQLKCNLSDGRNSITGTFLDISLSAGLTEFIALNLNHAPEFEHVTTLKFTQNRFSDDEISGFAKLIFANSSLKNLEISSYEVIDESEFLMLVMALESNTHLTGLTVSDFVTGIKINEKMSVLLSRNVAIAELLQYVQEYPLIETASFPLDVLNIIIEKTIVSYMVSGISKEETKNAIDELLRDASLYALEADVKNYVKQ